MECCQCQGIETRFDDDYVKKKLREYHEKGPKGTTKVLLDYLEGNVTDGMTLLDIGGGLGDIQHALLQAGISSSLNCEASTAYIAACQEEANRLGHGSRITHLHGNFVDVAGDVPPADIVTLDRVICCYHDMPELVGKSLAKARRFYGIIVPIDRWWVKLAIALFYNIRFLLQQNPFRVYVHPTDAMEALIKQAGFERVFFQVSGTWRIEVYSRQG